MKKIIVSILLSISLTNADIKNDISTIISQTKTFNATYMLPETESVKYMAWQIRTHINTLSGRHADMSRAEIKRLYMNELRNQYKTTNTNVVGLQYDERYQVLDINTVTTYKGEVFSFKLLVITLLYAYVNNSNINDIDTIKTLMLEDMRIAYSKYPLDIVRELMNSILHDMQG